jgi:hypothetical protein
MKNLIIVTLAYNNQNEVENTLKSTASVRKSGVVTHFVFDGSTTDSVQEICLAYSDLVYIRQTDTGIYDGINKAIIFLKERFSQSFILLLHSGDEFLLSPPEVLDISRLDSGDLVVGSYLLELKGFKKVKQYNSNRQYEMPSSHQAIFYSLDLPISSLLYDTDYLICADYNNFLHLKYTKNVKIIYVDNIVSQFSVGGKSTIEFNRLFVESTLIYHKFTRSCLKTAIRSVILYTKLILKYVAYKS